MARKVFISFLGYTNYSACRYYKDEFCSESVRYIQEATLDYLLKKEEWNSTDIAYILLTDGAKNSNWLDNGHRDSKTKEPIVQCGLQTCLNQKDYPFQIKTLEKLPVGKNEEELFEIFHRVYEVLEDGDFLYFDITHGFRSLPMLALVLINYSKFLKNIQVKSITYGNFEVREKDCNNNVIAPIIDLLPLSGIQDWTFAAADYLRNGNSKPIKELITDHKSAVCRGLKEGNKEDAKALNYLANSFERFINDFQTCRGGNLLSGNNLSNLKKHLTDYSHDVIEPLNPIIQKISESLSPFEEENGQPNFRNGFEAARWCIDHNLYQQAATILQENVVSFFCDRYKLNMFDIKERGIVNTVFAYHNKLNTPDTNIEEKATIRKTIDGNSILKKIFDDPIISSNIIYTAFSNLTDRRNDISHCGMRSHPDDPATIRDNIQNAFNVLSKKIC